MRGEGRGEVTEGEDDQLVLVGGLVERVELVVVEMGRRASLVRKEEEVDRWEEGEDYPNHVHSKRGHAQRGSGEEGGEEPDQWSLRDSHHPRKDART